MELVLPTPSRAPTAGSALLGSDCLIPLFRHVRNSLLLNFLIAECLNAI
jgi:hypothetical protein